MIGVKEYINFHQFEKINLNGLSKNDGCLIVILDANVVLENNTVEKQDLLLQNGKITAVNSIDQQLNADRVCIIDAKGFYLTPTLIDQHIHGAYGCNFNSCSEKELAAFLTKLPKHGIGAILPTVMTDKIESIRKQIQIIKSVNSEAKSTKILGIHLEGPLLSKEYKGIQPDCHILNPSIENYKLIEDDMVKMVSYAPELDKDFELTRYLSEREIIPSAGHTKATSKVIEDAIKAGLKQTTHTFNAMSPLNHRKPGTVGEALSNDNITTEIIADCRHVHPKVLKILFRAKPLDKVIIVSDSLPLSHDKHSSDVFGGQEIFKDGEKAINKDGTMAGSLMLLDSVAKKLVTNNILSFSQFIKYASYNVSKNLNLKNTGYIKQNYNADMVLWDKDFNVQMTFIDGKLVYNRNKDGI